jgi:sigma-B regulation protein RsbU (phosphoserine phosphatase)
MAVLDLGPDLSIRALIADDDRVAREIVSRTLSRWRFEVTSVADGEEAWRCLQHAEHPTLAILDWMMPGMNGPDICRRVRADRPLANMYLVLLTSLESRKDIVAGLDAGADDYIIKPFDPDELRARVQVGIRVLTLQERLADRVAELEEALSRVKRLQGLLPICSYCKRIRGDDQYWQSVDAYIAEHSDAEFSHGICPPCFEKAEKEIESYRKT